MDAATGFFVWGIPDQTVTITLAPGTYNLGFVTYNTVNGSAPTGFFLDHVYLNTITESDTPTMPPWALFILAALIFFVATRQKLHAR